MIPCQFVEARGMSKYTKSKYRLEGPWEQVRQQLANLESSDSHAEKQVGTGNKMLGGGCITGVLGLVSLALTGPFGGFVAFVGFSVAILGLVYNAMFSSYDLENMRYQVPTSLLDTLAVDLDPSKNVSVMIDFRASQSKEFIQKVEQSSFLFISTGPKVSYFSHPWLEFSGATVDGYRLKLNVCREGSYKQVPKRKRTKTKLRYVDSVTLAVRPPTGQAAAAPVGTPLAPPQTTRFRSFRGQVTAQGAMAKAVGPQYYTVSNRGTSSGGDHLQGSDLVVLFVACFRGLLAAPR
jgi:hypothetical protein